MNKYAIWARKTILDGFMTVTAGNDLESKTALCYLLTEILPHCKQSVNTSTALREKSPQNIRSSEIERMGVVILGW